MEPSVYDLALISCLIVSLLLVLRTWILPKYHQQKLAKQVRFIKKIYQNIDGHQLVLDSRVKLGLTAPHFTYGEINLYEFSELLSLAAPKAGEVFYDLGSGVGKTVLMAALTYPLAKATGIELLPSLVDVSLLQAGFIKSQHPQTQIHFLQQDFLEADLTDADIIYCNATGLFDDAWQSLLVKFTQLKPGTRIIVTSKRLPNKHFKLVTAGMRLMSWGFTNVFLYSTCN